MTPAGAFIRSGKVRDLYAVDADRLLLVASDRLSAFDVVLPTPVPDKGKVLTGLSRFWFAETAGIVPNHLIATDPAALPPSWTA
jgi:phosphoribosylaminoimidazole-succinocarboxamide synthase